MHRIFHIVCCLNSSKKHNSQWGFQVQSSCVVEIRSNNRSYQWTSKVIGLKLKQQLCFTNLEDKYIAFFDLRVNLLFQNVEINNYS